MLDVIDNILNDYTMYRVVLYGLGLLLAVAVVLGFTGAVSITPWALVVSVALLVASCYAANKLFSLALKVPTNTESWLITSLILACLLPPADNLTHALYTILAGVLAMAAKFLLRYRGKHIFNPAAFAAFVLSITALLPAIWWIATPWLTPFTVLLALAVLRKQRQFLVFAVFALAAVGMLVLTSTVLQGQALTSVLHAALVSWPIVFFGSIMLTEPATLPPRRDYQLLLALVIGLLFASQLHLGRLATTPQAVLLLGNLLTVLLIPAYGYVLKLKEVKQLAPNIYEASFKKPTSLRFRPGQYAELTLVHAHTDSRGNRRTFSVASSPSAPTVNFAFKVSPKSSSFKKALLAAAPGCTVRLGRVAGDFTLPSNDKPLLLIAGGIGITPYHSMLTSHAKERDIVLLYQTNAASEFIYREDFKEVRAEYLTKPLTATELQKLVPDFKQRLIYLSGPDAMVCNYKSMITGLGVGRTAIKTDYFSGY